MSFPDDIAIHTLWGEARGEPDEGVKAVAHVIINRALDGRWGPNAGTVCLWPWQFSSWNHSDPNWRQMLFVSDSDTQLLRCEQLWYAAKTEPDPLGGACFYYADSMAEPPNWAEPMTETAHIGHHHFLRDK